MTRKDNDPPSTESSATPNPSAEIDLSDFEDDPFGQDAANTEEDAALIQSHFPTHVVFHQVPKTGRNDAIVQAFADLEKTPLDLRQVPEIGVFDLLRVEFPWLANTIQILERACVLSRRGNQILRLPPLLMVGPAGIGKTSLLRRFCELADVPYLVISVGGASDSMVLKGSHRAWSTAQPGAVIRLIQQSRVANPIIIVDEVDKCGSGTQNGNLLDTLLQLIEPSSAATWHDEFLLGLADLSAVNYLMTANRTDLLSGPLLSRVRTVHHDFMGHTDLLRALPQTVAQVAQQYGWAAYQIPEMDSRWAQRIVGVSRDLRKLRQAVEVWLHMIAKEDDNQNGERLLH
ncbi:AAA family ATPase [Acidithiobacillus sp.]|uniref:AAA family ATPase n=1 Tax=Acidithiobacillus sp. TaxID=1872118 RepID=UPI0025BAEC31|nr:AAA family ATPase [Acidithiobacillus sp.]